MTEAEILSVRNEVTGLVISVVSVSFGMISAYMVALWLFLKDSPFVLRVLAFVLLTCGLAFMGGVTFGLNGLLLGTDQAWTHITAPATGISGFGNEKSGALLGLSAYEVSVAVGGVAFLAVYLALFFLTFIYRWPGTNPAR